MKMNGLTIPSRGEIWRVNLNPTRGHEQAGTRPALIISENLFNHGPAGLVVIIPITSKQKGIPLHIQLKPHEGGLKEKSFVKCEDIRSVSAERLVEKFGTVTKATLIQVEDRLRILLGL